MLKLRNNLLLIIGLFSGFVQASELSKQLLGLVRLQVEKIAEVQELIAAGANVNQIVDPLGDTPLINASYMGHTVIVCLLLAAGANVNQANTDGCTALFIASRRGHEAIVQMLLASGANVNQATTEGWTPLIIACENGHTQVVKMLIEAGANVNQAMIDGHTALDLALGNSHTATVEILEEKIAQDARWQDSRGAWCRAVHLASNNHLDDLSVV